MDGRRLISRAARRRSASTKSRKVLGRDEEVASAGGEGPGGDRRVAHWGGDATLMSVAWGSGRSWRTQRAFLGWHLGWHRENQSHRAGLPSSGSLNAVAGISQRRFSILSSRTCSRFYHRRCSCALGGVALPQMRPQLRIASSRSPSALYFTCSARGFRCVAPARRSRAAAARRRLPAPGCQRSCARSAARNDHP